jgi:integrase
VREKGGKRQQRALLEAAPSVVRYHQVGGILGDLDCPLFRPLARNRKTLLRQRLPRTMIWRVVKRYAREAGIALIASADEEVGAHALCKTAITNALEHGATIEQVQQLAGHADIRATQLYYQPKKRDAENAAMHIQVR